MSGKKENLIIFSVFVVGLSTIITQIALIRNFLSVFNGIELIIGIVFSNWMIITALGSFLGRHIKLKELDFRFIFFTHILLGLLPLILAFSIIFLRNSFMPPGKEFSLSEIYIGSFILLLPFCLISGLVFPIFSTIYSSEKGSNEIYRIYGIEAMGAIAGGILFNFVLIYFYNTIFILKLLLVFNFSIALFVYFIGKGKKIPWLIGFGSIIAGGIIITLDLDMIAYKSFFKNQELIEKGETPFGNLAVTRTSDQINFYENGVLLYSTDNIIQNEESVHYAMLQHPKPQNVLMISGGVSGIINEVLKYTVDSVDYLEIDPGIIKLSAKYNRSFKFDDRVKVINQDARLFLKKTGKKYDVILINLPDPLNSQLNRYFTLEFFEEVKQHMSTTGIVSISLSGSANYMSEASIRLHSALYSTMKLVYSNLIIIPGQRNYFIASDIPLSAKISNLAAGSYISNNYVNQFYLDDELIEQRKIQIEENISQEALINYDFNPSVYFLKMQLWLSKFTTQYIFLIIFIILMFLILLRFNPVNQGLFVTGFSATSLELILIIAFQVIYGYIYLMIGVFITLFMAGLVTGNLYIFKRIRPNYKNYSIIQYTLGITAILTPVILSQISSMKLPGYIIHFTFITLIILIGIITGLQFSLGTNLRNIGIVKYASGAYGADSLGSAFGALISVTFLIPQYGLVKVCLIIGILNIITGLYLLLKKRNFLLS